MFSRSNETTVLDGFKDKKIKVFLADRNIALKGKMRGHDKATIALEDSLGTTLVYKNRVISVTEDVDD